jgi:anti-anti-sigma factor
MSEPVTEIVSNPQAVVIVVRKRALDENSSRRLSEEVMEAAAATPRLPVVLDMARVRFAPSVALGELVQLSKSFKLDGRRLALINVEPNVLGVIHVTNLHTILQIHDTLQQVLDAAKPS